MASPDYATTARYSLRALKGDSNISDIDAGFLALAQDVEAKFGAYMSGTSTARAAQAPYDGLQWRDTDSGQVWLGNGTVWVQQANQYGAQFSSGYGDTGTTGDELVVGGGGASPNAASMSFGDGSGWKLNIGPKIAGAFTPRHVFDDEGNYTASDVVTADGGFVGGLLRPDKTAYAFAPNNTESDLYGPLLLHDSAATKTYLKLDGGNGTISFLQPVPPTGAYSNTMLVLPSGNYVFEAGAAFGPQGGTNPGYLFSLIDANGSTYTSGYLGGHFYTASDERLKENVRPLDAGDALARVRQIRAVAHTWKGDESGREEIAVIAQELEPVVPHAVASTRASGLGDMRVVDYARLVPLLIEAVKELADQVEARR